MKQNSKQLFFSTLLLCAILLTGCKDDDLSIPTVTVTLNFTHNWDGEEVSAADFSDFKFTTEAGDLLSIERLRYVVSDIQLVNASREVFEFNGHHLIDLSEESSFTIEFPGEFAAGIYSDVAFTFGLDNQDNAQNHPDLNSANFNVPEMLGGGYHYMQLDGKFINNNEEEQAYNYHSIRAVDISGPEPVFPFDTFFAVNLGSTNIVDDIEIEVQMNIAEWFKNPNTWELNELNTVLMPNPTAQILMSQNGKFAFSRGSISQ
jgi:hypothetical protein